VSFSYPVFVPIGAALAVVVVLGVWARSRRRRRLADFLGGHKAAGRLSGSRLHRLQIDRMLLLGSAALAAALAAAGPYQPVFDVPEEAAVRGTVVVAIDVSASMQANDVLPSRLSQAIRVARELVAPPANANVGVLLFAGQGYPLAHPTEDLRALDFLMQGVGPSVSSPQDPGSMLSTAILDAERLLDEGTPGGGERSIILISDGESGEAEAEVLAAVREAAARDVRVHTVGVGTPAGGEIPAARGSGQLAGFVLDANGAPAVSRLQEPLLQRIADEGGGDYAHSDETGDVQRLRRMLQSTGPGSATATLASRDLTLLLTALSLVLVVLDSLLELLDRGRRPRPRIPEFRMRFR
jgi:Ca-activated chloride channel family protein